MKVFVFLAEIPADICFSEVYPIERQAEIDGTPNDIVKAEKYCTWKLLEKVLSSRFGARLNDLSPKKKAGGGWVLDGFFLSLSHFEGYASAAVSKKPVGIDIVCPSDRFDKRIYDFITSESEREYFGADVDAFTVAKIFSEKEALVKRGEKYSTIKSADLTREKVFYKYFKDRGVLLSVAGVDDLEVDAEFVSLN